MLGGLASSIVTCMIGTNGCTLTRDGARFAGTYAVDSVRVVASTNRPWCRQLFFYTMVERQLMAGRIEGATKE
jgi:hypothetical protein